MRTRSQKTSSRLTIREKLLKILYIGWKKFKYEAINGLAIEYFVIFMASFIFLSMGFNGHDVRLLLFLVAITMVYITYKGALFLRRAPNIFQMASFGITLMLANLMTFDQCAMFWPFAKLGDEGKVLYVFLLILVGAYLMEHLGNLIYNENFTIEMKSLKRIKTTNKKVIW